MFYSINAPKTLKIICPLKMQSLFLHLQFGKMNFFLGYNCLNASPVGVFLLPVGNFCAKKIAKKFGGYGKSP